MKFPTYKIRAFLLICLISPLMLISNSCGDDDDDKNNSQIQLNSFGPSFLMRGQQLLFIGKNLDKVNSIVLPDNVEVSTFVTKTPTLLVIEVPMETVDGKVVLKTDQGDIETITNLVIFEPITIASIAPAEVRPGEKITITGTYLNLVTVISFKENKMVTSFESQSETKIEVIVPENAQTGKIVLSDDQEIPNLIESTTELAVALPAVTQISPLPVKAGNNLTLTGTNLDLTQDISFVGGSVILPADFVSMTATEIVVKVPANARDGKLKLRPLSKVEVESPALMMVAPTITNVTPNPAKNSGNIIVTGTNLDLVSRVVFGGGKEGSIQSGGTPGQITIGVPADAVDGKVRFGSNADKWDSTKTISLMVPTITNISPLSINTIDNPSITITGTDLDIVKTIIFGGTDWKADIATSGSKSATAINIPVTPGSVSGKIKIVTTNGTEVMSSQSLTIVPNVPAITSLPAEAFIGEYLTIGGTNMNVPSQIIFPGNNSAVNFGNKTATEIVVLVPAGTPQGSGRIKFVTNKNEVYESPLVNFKLAGPEPVVDAALMINNFDGPHNLTSNDNWGSNVTLGTTSGVSGNYMRGTNANAAAWTWIWGCNHSDLPKVSVDKATHLLKMDIKITIPIPANANFQIELGGSRIDVGNLGGSTVGWKTITYDLSTFPDLPAIIPGSGEWGINLQSGTVNLTGLYIDNIRFQAK